LADGLKLNTKIIQFSAGCNSIGDIGVKYLSEALAVNQTLQNLSLVSNNIGPEGANYLGQALAVNHSLLQISLGYALSTRILGQVGNNIGDQGAIVLAKHLVSNKILQVLVLQKNNITKVGAEAFRDLLKYHNTTLINLYLGRTKIIGVEINDEINVLLRTNMKKITPLTNKVRVEIRDIRSTFRKPKAKKISLQPINPKTHLI